MNQKELIEMHMHLSGRGWEIQALQSEGVWLYNFSKELNEGLYIIELLKVNSGYKIAVSKNSEECKELTETFTSYDQSLYTMEILCNKIENKI